MTGTAGRRHPRIVCLGAGILLGWFAVGAAGCDDDDGGSGSRPNDAGAIETASETAGQGGAGGANPAPDVGDDGRGDGPPSGAGGSGADGGTDGSSDGVGMDTGPGDAVGDAAACFPCRSSQPVCSSTVGANVVCPAAGDSCCDQAGSEFWICKCTTAADAGLRCTWSPSCGRG